ncbi:MAG: CpsD/CapB family tyrosine-protein kinase [Acidobacteria bacterium]|nr:CpsD/CapB family tyrosine-protein kinase [Acidobacteriota bacterium]
MSKVYEALLRQQQVEKKEETARDPLAAETGSPDSLEKNGQENVEPANFELPSVIGTPVGPRSNEGALFSTFNHHSFNDASSPQSPATKPTPAIRQNDQVTSQAPTPNGKATEHRRPAYADSRAIAEKLKKAPPVIRRTELEISDPKSQISETENGSTVTATNSHTEETPNPQSAIRNQKRQHEVPVEPIQQSKLHPRLIMLTTPQAPECEQYRTLRTQLFHAAERKKTQVVTVTSTLAGEGKTSTAINLALAIAQSEKRVLLIDGDLRRPNVATYLGTRAKAGFGEALNGEGNPLDLLFTIEGHELYLLAVSRESSNPTELLSSDRLAEMIADLRRYFDFILIDSPPVLPFADARLLANHADAVMLVVRAGMAPYETVEKAIEALPAGKMLGVVLNDAELTEEAGYYDYYYNYAQRTHHRSWWRKLLRPIRNSKLGRKLKL